MEEEEKIPSDAEQVKSLAVTVASGDSAMQMRVESAMKEEERMLTPAQGLEATEALARFDAIQTAGMKKYSKSRKGDGNGVRLFMARHGGEMAKKRNALARVVAAEARHGFEQSVKNATESDIRRLAEVDIAEGTATTLEQSLDADATNESMNSSLSETDGWREFMERQIDRSEDMAKEEKDAAHGAVSTAATGMKTASAKIGVDALNAVAGQNEQKARGQTKPYIDNIRKIFLRRYKAQRTMRQSHEIAYANALEATRNASITYFKERLAKGQFSDVMFMLDELEKNSDKMFDQSKDEAVGGIYDPSNLGFLHHSDVNALRTAAITQLREFERVKRMKNAQTLEGLKIQNAQIRFNADKLARQSILNMDEMEKLFEQTEGLIQAGLPQAAETSSYLRGIVEKAERKYNKAQKDATKLETEDDFNKEYDAFQEQLMTSAPMYFFAGKGVPYADGKSFFRYTMDENGNPIHIDGQNRMILLIRNGLDRGIIKGKVWTDRLSELEADRAKEDYYASMRALGDAGIEFDAARTRDLVDARGGALADVADERGEQTASTWTEDRSGRLRVGNPDYMMYKWKDPVNGSEVSITGRQLNDLLAEVSEWQRRHPNPSPTGEKPKELTDFISRSLSEAAVRGLRKHWFSANEKDVVLSFGDIRLAAHDVAEKYFAPRGNAQVYGRDMRSLRGAVLRGDLPTTDAIKKSIEAWRVNTMQNSNGTGAK